MTVEAGPVRWEGTRRRGELLLALWESGVGCQPWARADALLAAAGEATARTLGQRTRDLLRLYASLFGPDAELISRCPSCDMTVTFRMNCGTLLDQLPATADAPAHRLDVDGYTIEFRLPTGADVAAASHYQDDHAFARQVIERCVLTCTHDDAASPARELPDAVLDALSRQMEAVDPGATVSFALDCPDCQTMWDAPLDTGQLVWQRVQSAAERLFLDVDALARAYGWTEQDVLSLPPARRAAYLQMVTA